jgi:hypothetical protein
MKITGSTIREGYLTTLEGKTLPLVARFVENGVEWDLKSIPNGAYVLVVYTNENAVVRRKFLVVR